MNEAELKEWVEQEQHYQQSGGTTVYNKQVVDVADLTKLFAGKKLVDAGAVVLNMEAAESMLDLAGYTVTTCPLGDIRRAHLSELCKAIEQTRGKNGKE